MGLRVRHAAASEIDKEASARGARTSRAGTFALGWRAVLRWPSRVGERKGRGGLPIKLRGGCSVRGANLSAHPARLGLSRRGRQAGHMAAASWWGMRRPLPLENLARLSMLVVYSRRFESLFIWLTIRVEG